MSELLCYALQAYWLVMIVRIILSFATQVWSPPAALTPVIRVVYDLTEPVLGFFRRFIPPIGMLDLSPLFVFVILNLLMSTICV